MKKRLHEIQSFLNEPLLQPAIEAVATVELRLGNSAAILGAADEVGKTAYGFAEEADGSRLSALDSLLPQPGQFKQ
jgi:hypothetical protein